MDEKIKIYEPNEIEDTPIYPVEDETGSTDSTSDTTGVSSPNTLPPTSMPNYIMASDLVNESLDTQMRKIKSDYGFTETGSIKIGKYVATVSGEIYISPDGIVGISKDDGLPSFALDGQTGNATFKGTIQAGSLVVGYVADVGGSYTTTATAAAAKVKIFPDANTGIIAYASNGTTVVFKVEVGGTNVGDVTIGNYSGGKGILWDQSAGTMYLKGDISASTGDISGNRISGGTIDGVNLQIGSGDDIFKADSNGIYLGDSTFADAPFRVNMDGDVVAKSILLWGTIDTTSGAYLRTSSGNSRLEFTNGDKLTFYNGGSIKGQIRGGSNSGMIAEVGSFVTKVDEGFYACVNSSFSDFFKFYCTDVSGTVSGVIEAPNSNKIYLTDADGNTLSSWSTTQFYSAQKILVGDGIEMNDTTIYEVGMANFNEHTSAPNNNDGIWYYKSGGSYGFRTKMEGGNWSIDQTAI